MVDMMNNEKDYEKKSKTPNWEWISDIANDDNYCDNDVIDIEQEICKALIELKQKG